MADMSRRELFARMLQGAAAIVLADKVAEGAIESVARSEQREPTVNPETSPLITDMTAGRDKIWQEACLRAYLANPGNTQEGRPDQDYVSARMVNEQPELHYSYTPEGMWCNFKWFGHLNQPRAIKYLRH